jgi:hypothetical protein
MTIINFRSPLAIIALAGVLGACDNPVEHEDHAQPDGVVIRAGAAEIIRVDDDGVQGALTVVAGAETPDLTVTFVDHDGDDITLEADEYWLSVSSASSATATWQGTAAGSFNGRVAGHVAGATTLELVLYHGPVGGGHPEEGATFVVPVAVTATLQ